MMSTRTAGIALAVVVTACEPTTPDSGPPTSTPLVSDQHHRPIGLALDGQPLEVDLSKPVPEVKSATYPLATLSYSGHDQSGRWSVGHTLDLGSDTTGLQWREPIPARQISALFDESVPSGDLYVYDEQTGETWQIDRPGQFALHQVWSPTEPGILYYTYAEMEGVYGLAEVDVRTGEVEVLVGDDVVAEYISFSTDGSRVEFLVAGEPLRLPGERHATREVYAESLPVAPGDSIAKVRTPLPVVGDRRPLSESENGEQPFELGWRSGARLVGDDILGTRKLEVQDAGGEVLATIDGAYRVEALTDDGALVRIDTPAGTDLAWVLEDGTVMTVGSSTSTPSFKMPMPKNGGKVLNVTQMGESYSTACRLYSHRGSLGYAIDMQSIASTEAILAAGKGSVVTAVKTVTCNSLDDPHADDADGTTCRLYSSGCTSDYGNYVILLHRDGKYTSYSHMGYGTVTPDSTGTTAYRGCLLGEQGGTGATLGDRNGCGDHLHLARSSSSSIYGSTINFPFPDARHSPLQCTWYKSGNEYRTCDL
ncbi:MAG: hypothetical protein H6742_16575 [Alphaproteobacteria bacterium]|nr:hypothetical protein [Alphaproteobacteria bacterium]